MDHYKKTTSRKKILLWVTAILSSLIAMKYVPFSKKNKKQTVKMLSQDGELVEIDKALLASSGKKISDTELQNWIRK